MDVFAILFILGLAVSNMGCANGKRHPRGINVLHHGARGDGETDDSQAFLKVWEAACNAGISATRVIVPGNRTYLLNPVFHGPCETMQIDFVIKGKIVAPESPSFWDKEIVAPESPIFWDEVAPESPSFWDEKGVAPESPSFWDEEIGAPESPSFWDEKIVAPESPSFWDEKDASLWLAFKSVTGLNVYGAGIIDGRGKKWWDQSCRYHPELKGCTKVAPTALKFLSCNDCSLSNMKVINSPQTHVLIQGCNGIKIDRMMIKSPGDTANTDGIHIHSSNSLTITNSTIGSGDDCISIGDYISDLDISNIECGPGHGISIGSLGNSGNVVRVENIRVSDSSFTGTTNGARIKTWQVGRGYVRNIVFENLTFHEVKNPLIIDQNYCEVRGACEELPTGVQISNVIYRGFSGTSASDIAINLNCSRSVPCSGFTMEAIKLTSATTGKQVSASCVNVQGTENNVEPGPCLNNQD